MADARTLADDLGADYSDSAAEAAEAFARSGSAGRLPTDGWAAYERQDDSLLMASGSWRLRASRNADKGWLIVESYRCA